MDKKMKADYRKPTAQFIGRSRTSEKLYNLERKVEGPLRAAARELGNLLGFKPDQLWTHAMPEALLNILDSSDAQAALLAAQVFIEKHGYTMTRTPKE